MNKYLMILVIGLVLFFACNAQNSQNRNVRNPAVAGQFYPADSTKLYNAVKSYLADAVSADLNKPVAVVSPHAGYIFSGQVAADAYNQVKDFDYDVVIIIGTNHTTAGFSKISVYNKGSYRTPFGNAEIDEELAQKIIDESEDCFFNPQVHTREHSVEVQIPFIQYLFPKTKVVPIVIGSSDFDMCTAFGKTLGRLLKEQNPLIIASSDLSHYPKYENAREVDLKTLNAIAGFNAKEVYDIIEENMELGINGLSTCACGQGSVVAAMTAARELEVNCGTVVSYLNSGDVSLGDRNRVVGYGAVAFSKEENCNQKRKEIKTKNYQGSFELDENKKSELIKFARKTIQQYLISQTTPVARKMDESLAAKRGAFVTLNKNGQLRGCIGHMSEDTPLDQVVGAMALQAAFNDTRFSPLRIGELEEIEIEISVLTPFQKVNSYEEIVIGRDGVVLRKDNKSAVFLPQVAPEQGWGLEEMLNNLSRKAGLGSGKWKDATFYTFQAEVFHESDLN